MRSLNDHHHFFFTGNDHSTQEIKWNNERVLLLKPIVQGNNLQKSCSKEKSSGPHSNNGCYKKTQRIKTDSCNKASIPLLYLLLFTLLPSIQKHILSFSNPAIGIHPVGFHVIRTLVLWIALHQTPAIVNLSHWFQWLLGSAHTPTSTRPFPAPDQATDSLFSLFYNPLLVH